jgi:bifunctional N-acetylglucosamine-1-phosphate-uridyltransferase/glucosamine-1-phosphate-acetyltransferase GlmU-like protein
MKRKNNLIWNAIIPAAGKSSRFKSVNSKVLFKIKKKTLLEITINKILPYVSKITIIVNKDNKDDIIKIITKYKKFYIDIKIQKKINGMATAIQTAFPLIKSENMAIIWADQIGISKKIIKKTMESHLLNNDLITFPIVYKKYPYTFVKFDKNKILKNISQSREAFIYRKFGYSDCGFFCCVSNKLKAELNNLIKQKKIITKKTKEYDFLMALNLLSKKYKIRIIESNNKKDSIGINTRGDLNNL